MIQNSRPDSSLRYSPMDAPPSHAVTTRKVPADPNSMAVGTGKEDDQEIKSGWASLPIAAVRSTRRFPLCTSSHGFASAMDEIIMKEANRIERNIELSSRSIQHAITAPDHAVAENLRLRAHASREPTDCALRCAHGGAHSRTIPGIMEECTDHGAKQRSDHCTGCGAVDRHGGGRNLPDVGRAGIVILRVLGQVTTRGINTGAGCINDRTWDCTRGESSSQQHYSSTAFHSTPPGDDYRRLHKRRASRSATINSHPPMDMPSARAASRSSAFCSAVTRSSIRSRLASGDEGLPMPLLYVQL